MSHIQYENIALGTNRAESLQLEAKSSISDIFAEINFANRRFRLTTPTIFGHCSEAIFFSHARLSLTSVDSHELVNEMAACRVVLPY